MYKWHGRNQNELMIHAFQEFLVHEFAQNCKPQSQLSRDFSGFPTPFGADKERVGLSIVPRVMPRTSKGTTDLLLLNLVQLYDADFSKKTMPTLY